MMENNTGDRSIPSRRFLPPRVEILRLDLSHHRKRPAARPVENRDDECTRVVARLHSIVREHRTSARRIGTPLDNRSLQNIIAALHAESYGADYRPYLEHPDPVADFLRNALFNDLLEVPCTLLFTTRSGTGTNSYKTMAPSLWRECLSLLMQRLDIR